MQIRLATDSDRPAWDDYVLTHPDGLAYHQYAWRKAVESAYGFAGIYLVAEDAVRVCGVLPLVDFKLPLLGRKLVSLPYCDVGGALADDGSIAESLKDHALKLAREMGAKGVELRNIHASGEGGQPAVSVPQKVRMVLDLPESSEVLMASLRSKLRSQVKKPVRDGLTARLGGPELVDTFYRVFAENMRDLGSPVHSLRWIRAVVGAFGERCRVGLVHTADGQPVAAGIILLHGDKVSIPWASSLRRMNRFNPNMLLYWTFLAFAADNGFRHFDFGRSSVGEGTYRFKEQWGAEAIPLDWQQRDAAGRLKAASGEGGGKLDCRRKVESLWSKLPLTFCNGIGPLVRRCVSL